MASRVAWIALTCLAALVALPAAGAGQAGAAAAQAGPPAGQAGPAPAAVSASWVEIASAAHRVGASGIQERRFELAIGSARVALHRYARSGADDTRVLLYLPGTNMNGAPALTDERHNLWLYLAARGITVYALDYRSHFIAADARDFAPMAAWTVDVYVDDATRALALVHAQMPRGKVFVAGFSRGVTLAYGLVCRAPVGQLAGLIALDGGFKRARGTNGFLSASAAERSASAAERGNETYAAARARFVAAGRFADDVGAGIGWEARQSLMRNALGGDAAAQAQLTQVLTNAWGPGRLANPGAISDVAVLARLMLDYDRFYPAVQTVDGDAIARVADAPHTPLDDCWGHMTVPILFVESEHFGAAPGGVGYSAVHSGSRT